MKAYPQVAEEYREALTDLFIDYQMWPDMDARNPILEKVGQVFDDLTLGMSRFRLWREEFRQKRLEVHRKVQQNLADHRDHISKVRVMHRRKHGPVLGALVKKVVKNPDCQVSLGELVDYMSSSSLFSSSLYTRIPALHMLRTQSVKYSGEWRDVPWSGEHWYDNSPLATAHMAHISVKDPTLIAYNQSNEKLLRDIQTPIKPGRYLQQFFGDVLSAEEIRHWANLVNVFSKGPTLKFLNNNEWQGTQQELMREWVRLYNVIEVDYSCMRGSSAVEVYGLKGNGLGLAYLECPDGTLMCRSIVRFNTKEYIRCYPGEVSGWKISEAELAAMLEEQGFTGGDLYGAHLVAKEQYSGRYVCPYIDGAYDKVSLDCFKGQDTLCIGDDGVKASNTCGWVEIEHCECAHCGNDYDEDEGTYVEAAGGDVCPDCIEDHYIFAMGRRNEDWYLIDDCIEVDGTWYQKETAHYHDIQPCAECDDWYHIDNLFCVHGGDYVCDDCCVSLDEEDDEGNRYARPDEVVELSDGRTIHESVKDDYVEDEDEATDTTLTDTTPKEMNHELPLAA